MHRLAVPLVASLLAAPSLIAQGSNPPAATPGALKVTWTYVVITSDGGRMVSDGGLMLDITLARPAIVPTRVIPSSAAIKALEQHMLGPHTSTFGPLDLNAGPRPGTYAAPNGILLNTTYVDFLRDGIALDMLRLRFGAKGPRDPIAILVGGKPVGVMMPVAGAKPQP